ncbi:hypothetical protein CBR_g26144 [Chara braunii]|uniref:Myb-like domain-containing protein n=1 Tax=Chara braunii TaxID=69332 RepID=A0A388JW11_CHABU|nr:hypothetical protein CBR_g26144 [Chara braunii]|eukprot:GBG61980.1 hypothetical protein CBR_g26144 [Chara braunii]
MRCFSPRASTVPGSNRWGMPHDGQNCVGWSAPTAGVDGQRQQPQIVGVGGSKGALSMAVEPEPSLAQGSVGVEHGLGPYSSMLQCGNSGSDMQPTSRFQPSRNLGGKDVGPPSLGGSEGAYGNADCNVGDAWMGGVSDIVGTQYEGCSSAGSDGEFNVKGRSDVSNNDGSPRRIPAGGGGSDGEPTAKGKARSLPGGGGGDGEPAAKGKPRSPDWSTNESVRLLRSLFEEDALQQKRKGRQKMRTRKEKYGWIILKLVEKGFKPRNVEECECKFYSLLDNEKRISDFHLRSSEWIYWNMDRWKLRKAEWSCEGVMSFVQYNEGGLSAVTDNDDTGGGSGSLAPRRREGSDAAEGSKSARTEVGGGGARRNRSQSSAEGNMGGTFADVAHALVESNDRQADKMAGSFANAMDVINNTFAQGNTTLLQCFTMLSGSLSGRSAEKETQ